jgi:hypothetical protein
VKKGDIARLNRLIDKLSKAAGDEGPRAAGRPAIEPLSPRDGKK